MEVETTTEAPAATKTKSTGAKKGATKARVAGKDAHTPADAKHKGGTAQGKTQEGDAPRIRVTIEGDNGPLTINVPPGSKEPKLLRGESKRGKLLESLGTPKGITMNQACSRFEWKPRDFADAIRLLAKFNGVASHRDEHNHWHLAK
jgi:hypothetical protein